MLYSSQVDSTKIYFWLVLILHTQICQQTQPHPAHCKTTSLQRMMNHCVALISKIQFNIHHSEYNARTFSSYLHDATFSINFRCRCVVVHLQWKCMNQILCVLQTPIERQHTICIVVGWLDLVKHMFSWCVCVWVCISWDAHHVNTLFECSFCLGNQPEIWDLCVYI